LKKYPNIEPHIDRTNLDSVSMPIELLNNQEKLSLKNHLQLENEKDLPSFIDENLREILPLRDTGKGFNINTPHVRKSSKSRRNTTK
jgi:hypothetical protein